MYVENSGGTIIADSFSKNFVSGGDIACVRASTVSGVWIRRKRIASIVVRATKFASWRRGSGVVRFEKRR